MAYILHIESSSTVCSVALSNNETLIAVKELNSGYTHAENMHVFIQEVLKEAGIIASQLNAISVSSGPGSYTGLRIGFSTAKGLAYALQIPLISVDTLKALTTLAIETNNGDTKVLYCPMMDARRMEVYTALYTHELEPIKLPNALVLTEESVLSFANLKPICFFGDGMLKAKSLLEMLPNTHFMENMYPGAKAMIGLAYRQYTNQDFVDVAYAEPFYLKDFFFTVSKK